MNEIKLYLMKGTYLILIFIGFTQCGLFSVLRIESEKIPLYKKNDTLIFKSSLNVDSFYVKSAGISGISEGEGEHLYENYVSECVQIDSSDYDCSFMVVISPHIYILYVRSNNSSVEDFGVSSKGDSLQIGNYVLKDLYVSTDNKIIDSSSQDPGITDFTYSMKYGIVEYKLSNGETFQILEESIDLMNKRK